MECGKDIKEIHANERKHELWLSFLFDMLYLFQDKVRYDDRLPRLITVKFYGKDFVPAGRRLVCPHGRLHLATQAATEHGHMQVYRPTRCRRSSRSHAAAHFTFAFSNPLPRLSLLEIQRFSPLSSSTTTSSLVESSRSRRMLPSFTSRWTTSARWHPASASASCATMRPLRTPGWARCGGGGPSPAGQAPCRGP